MESQRTEGRGTQAILIVEEDESIRRILDLSLRHAGFAVGLASTHEEALKRLADGPDLVIAGATDPDGLALCRRVKQTRRPASTGGGADLRAGAGEQDARPRGRRGRLRGQADLRAGGGGAGARAPAATRTRAPRALRPRTNGAAGTPGTSDANRGAGAEDRPLRERHQRRAAGRSAARDRRAPKIGRRGDLRRRRRARRDLLPPGKRGRRRGRASVGTRGDLPAVLLVGRAARGRVEEHPAQGHDRDAPAGSPDGGVAAGRRVAPAAGGAAAARHDLRGRLPDARRAAGRHPRRGEPDPAPLRRGADLPAGDRRLRSPRSRRGRVDRQALSGADHPRHSPAARRGRGGRRRHGGVALGGDGTVPIAGAARTRSVRRLA